MATLAGPPNRKSDSSALRDVLPYVLRLGVFGIALVGLCQLLYLGATTFGAEWMGQENGPVEAVQLAFIGAAAFGFAAAACRSSIGTSGMCLAAAVLSYTAARESDALIEQYLFDDAYKWLVGLPAATVATFVLIKRRRHWITDFTWSAQQPATTAFVLGGILLCSLGQLLDRPGFWGGLTESQSAYPIAVMVEEIVELFAYLMLAFAGFEAWWFSRRSPRDVETDGTATIQDHVVSRPGDLHKRAA